jgi:oxygen-independent coproporphyrinogen III oxidase
MSLVPASAIPASNMKKRNKKACEWDSDLIAKYDVAGPRYTSYPTAPQFTTGFTHEDYRREASGFLKHSIAPLSLYLHIPFCQNICYYCACNKVVTSDQSVSRRYLDYLAKEIQLQSALTSKRRTVMQLHLGGGTPTFLDGAELTELMHLLAVNFSLTDSSSREYSIEIDPRTVTKDSLALLKGLGFNRLSLGVQDFDEKVQLAVNRRQSLTMIKTLTEAARLYQYKSVSYDLIYGLPQQTPQTLTETLDKVIDLSPDRIAFYNYAHLPERFKPQRAIARQQLPTAEQKIRMLELISSKLTQAGYLHIGMDHFVKSGDDLAKAREQGKLQRNFQGYSTCMAPDLLGLGVSAISSLKDCYAQNEPVLEDYYRRLDADEIPINKGVKLSNDDLLRREVISHIACDLQLDTRILEQRYNIVFSDYFSQELLALKSMENDGLVYWQGAKMIVSGRGRSILRNICMPFDKYLQQGKVVKFSQTL